MNRTSVLDYSISNNSIPMLSDHDLLGAKDGIDPSYQDTKKAMRGFQEAALPTVYESSNADVRVNSVTLKRYPEYRVEAMVTLQREHQA